MQTTIIVVLFLVLIITSVLINMKDNGLIYFNSSFRSNFLKEGFENDDNQLNEDLAIDGFKGIYQSTKSKHKQIDKISLRKGNKDCIDSGLTNSMGYLCLSLEDSNLLKTRGGNDILPKNI